MSESVGETCVCFRVQSLFERESVPEIKNREKRTLGVVLLNDTIVLHVVLESMKLSFSGILFLIVYLVNSFEKKIQFEHRGVRT